MDKYDKVIKILIEAAHNYNKCDIIKEEESNKNNIPVGISNRHIHLSKEDLECLFGVTYELNKLKDLSQPGQFACKETVIICGPKGAIEKVRVLGPVRKETQVEVLFGDCVKLGITPVVKISGNLEDSSAITIIGPKGSVYKTRGAIVAQRHIHMTLEDAKRFRVYDGENVKLKINGLRGGVFENVVIRATDASSLECHIDIEEANAFGLTPLSTVTILK